MRAHFAILCLTARLVAADFTVHEWGTFTSVVGSDGRMLPGLEVEEERVPNFVHSLAGFAPANKGWDRPVRGVTVKMETPVLYFYSASPQRVRVEVRFNGGSISQWYPNREDGENPPAGPTTFTPAGRPVDAPPPIDFSTGYRGHATWHADILAPATPVSINTPRELETPQWPRARVKEANLVRSARGEVEGFIFYRGMGHFELPLAVEARDDSTMMLRNTGNDPLPFLWVYERTGHAHRDWCGAIAAGERQLVRTDATAEEPERKFQRALVDAGLSEHEAAALRATWRESYFERPGLRVFWIVPRAFTDAVLPLALQPPPKRLERVLVGRTEVMTPAFEAQLREEFARDGGKRWAGDRYFRAYRARVEAMASDLGIAAAGIVP